MILAKAKPFRRWIGDVLFGPDISIDVAKNIPSSANLMKFRADFEYADFVSDVNRPYQGARLDFGGGFETDRDFEATNLLGEFEYRPLLKGLYDPVSDEDVGTGHIVEIALGIEGGSSLQDRTFKKDDIDGTLKVPRFGILRVRPRVRFFLERKFSPDFSLSLNIASHLRVLLAEERMGEVINVPMGEAVAKTLSLRRADGFKPYSTATVLIGFSKRFALAIDYKNGTSPPLFQNVNTVSTGFVFKR